MNKRLISAIVILWVACSSCSMTRYRYIYTASPANNPYFTEKGDSKFAGYYSDNGSGGEDLSNGFDLQAGYAISNHLAIIAGYYNRKEKVEERIYGPRSTIVSYKRDMVDGGFGFFAPINKKKTIFFNFYTGYSGGKFSLTDEQYFYKNKINKWFFQPSLNFMPGKYFRFSFSAKTSFVHFRQENTNYTEGDIGGYGLEQIRNNTKNFFEPSISVQVGLPKIPWVKIEGILSGITNYRPYNEKAAVRDGNSSIGLYFDFSKMKRSH